MRFYLGGPINGCTDEEASGWREAVKPILEARGHFWLDPMDRDYRGRELEPGIATEIVVFDKQDIDNCDVMLMNRPKLSDGSASETVYGWERSKFVVSVYPEGARPSPWMIYHSHEVRYGSVIEAARELADRFEGVEQILHYHGTPITPRTVLHELAGRCFCVRYGEHRDADVCHEIGQSVVLDNGAFPAWTKGKPTDWPGFVAWAKPYLEHHTTWAVMPDVIGGTEEENDLLIAWLFNHDREVFARSAPVWHMDESIERLKRLCHGYGRVCIGSSGLFRDPDSDPWRRQMERAMNAVCGSGPAPTWLHMLRAMDQAAGGPYPFASADSTNIARNHAGTNSGRPKKSAAAMAARVDGFQTPARWRMVEHPMELAA